MHFTIAREDLTRVLRKVSGVVDRKSAINPVLSNVLLDLTDKELTVTASDSSVELTSSVDGFQITNPGKITVNFRKFKDACDSLPQGGEIEIKLKDNKLLILSGKTRFSLLTLPSEMFPVASLNSGVISFFINKDTLKPQLEKTAFSMADQDVRYFLNGMLFEVRDGVLYTVSTDGHRLAMSFNNIDISKNKSIRVIVPRKSVLEIIKSLDDVEGDVEIIISINHIKVKTPGFTLISKLLEGKFPDYEKVIPSGGDKEVFASKDLLKDAFNRASVLFNEKQKGVRVLFSPGKISLFSNSAEQDESREEVDADFTGDNLEVCFNARYLIDYFRVTKADTIKITLSDATSGALFGGDEGGAYVVMPMRI